ncbi:hypothetical protein [Methylobacterium sp. J-092]|uniref:hypothetical protein n=1 Tax=Methylobacterium sp. J-092 TaxID=2836667 RepID=UPI001FB98AD9|nr:hypothetical protein [Methylobacterium sp. J-092]MCJ2007874.1 hypothetical protein [Methylobacterium sp. J-092]
MTAEGRRSALQRSAADPAMSPLRAGDPQRGVRRHGRLRSLSLGNHSVIMERLRIVDLGAVPAPDRDDGSEDAMRRRDLEQLLPLAILSISTVLAVRLDSRPGALATAASAACSPLMKWWLETRRMPSAFDDGRAIRKRPIIIAAGWTLLGTAIAARPLYDLVAALDGGVAIGSAVCVVWSGTLYWILRS